MRSGSCYGGSLAAAGVVILAIALAIAPLAAGQSVRRCRVGADLTDEDRVDMERNFYATIVARYGADSRQAQLFVPKDELDGAITGAAGLSDTPRVARATAGEGAAPLDASELERLTDWAEAMGAEAAAGAAGGGRRLPQDPGQSITTIDTYIHVITAPGGAGKLSPATIQKQMDAINDAYKSTNFQFKLVGVDTFVNRTWFNGVRINGKKELEMKSATRKGSAATLNVWTVKLIGDNGFSSFPDEYIKDPALDGVVIDYRTLPGVKKGGYFARTTNLGHTLNHESGHWMGLRHTFEGGCDPDVTKGDYVADTPAEREPKKSDVPCNKNRDSCPGTEGALLGNDPVENFMDYSRDSCYERFSPGQIARMAQQWIASRLGK